MSENQEDKKLVFRFVIALGLAVAAGALNYYYLSGVKTVEYLVYKNSISPGQTLSDEDFATVSLPIPRDDKGTVEAIYASVFREPDERAILVDSKSTYAHDAGEIVVKEGTSSGNSPAPEFSPFGEFLVLDVNGNSVTVQAKRDKNGAFTEQTNRLIQLTSSERQLANYRVVNIVELARTEERESAAETKTDDGDLDLDFDGGADDADSFSGAFSLPDVDKITVELPKTCRISGSIGRGTKVAFVVPTVVLTDRERSGKSK